MRLTCGEMDAQILEHGGSITQHPTTNRPDNVVKQHLLFGTGTGVTVSRRPKVGWYEYHIVRIRSTK